MPISRRDFLMRVGQAGGYTAAFTTMQSLGLIPMKAVLAEPINASSTVGKGTKVVVLGGGIGGLVSAYELRKHGYDVTLLEARERPGGRNWTGRNGTKVEFIDGTTQTIAWEEGNYQNLGPARLPSTHVTMLGYARELGVPLEVEINTTRSSLLQNDKANGGKPVPQRKAINDTRGHVSELLAKCIKQGALDSALTPEDRTRMADFLGVYGPLDKTGAYVGSERAGIKVYPGAGKQVEVDEVPLDMHTLLDADFWNGILYEEVSDWQATMMQPVGGMDQIPYAFAKSLGPIIHYNSPVTEIRKTATGVRISYTQGGHSKQIEAPFCVSALPFSMLKKIPNDLSAPYKNAIDNCTMGASFKIPWEAPRFWETDYNIYGGLSFVSQGPSPIWYPSSRLNHPTGIVVSGYMDEVQVPGFSDWTNEQRFAASRASIEKIHPGHGKDLKNPIFCGWKHVKWNEGSWIAEYGGGEAGYDTVIEPDGPIYLAGDTISHLVGWQEGAALSARRAVSLISDKVKASPAAGA
ncbi:flavin monoamine oxidase family protein [Granulicella sibirica]|uniref:Tryptophan 2-monooxygenase n=1 Tax=Granulicella sibirica TaxID=2479048 RepID=A0A4Q0T459_9BACT|nr:FAD-dependent oxidoreductase [Granulicella sibirica]RXH56336.1 Amine oxidase, flavin-containing [Granulicella sibirica]